MAVAVLICGTAAHKVQVQQYDITDLFEKCNYNCHLTLFLANGRHTAAHFRDCWECSVTQAGTILHGSTVPSANPLKWPIKMAGLGAGPEFQLMVQTQCALTLACEAHEWAALNKKFCELPLLDPILDSW